MLKIGIVGKNYSESYISIINSSEYFDFIGIFDPSFQFEYPKYIKPQYISLSFEELVKKTDVIAFASPERIYFPLIELALKYSRPVFLHSVHNLSQQEQIELLKLNEEAGEILQIHQPIVFHDTFIAYKNFNKNPQLLQYTYTDNSEVKLLSKTRMVVGAVLALMNSNVRKITANTLSVCSAVPDIIKLRIDFDNGSLAEIMVNAVETERINYFKIFEYNGFFEIDLNKNQLKGRFDTQKVHVNSMADNNIPQKLLEKQLLDFYENITTCRTPLNSIDNEINTQKIIEKVKEKLRININIF